MKKKILFGSITFLIALAALEGQNVKPADAKTTTITEYGFNAGWFGCWGKGDICKQTIISD